LSDSTNPSNSDAGRAKDDDDDDDDDGEERDTGDKEGLK